MGIGLGRRCNAVIILSMFRVVNDYVLCLNVS